MRTFKVAAMIFAALAACANVRLASECVQRAAEATAEERGDLCQVMRGHVLTAEPVSCCRSAELLTHTATKTVAHSDALFFFPSFVLGEMQLPRPVAQQAPTLGIGRERPPPNIDRAGITVLLT